MRISSSAFEQNGFIPSNYTCDGGNTSPPLQFDDVPNAAVSLALTVTDPDAPRGTFTHWLIWNISPNCIGFDEGQTPAGTIQGRNDAGQARYMGPCPPSGVHHYYFKLFALDQMLDRDTDTTRTELEQAMANHVIDQAELVGLYQH